jgi:hypothetical protein
MYEAIRGKASTHKHTHTHAIYICCVRRGQDRGGTGRRAVDSREEKRGEERDGE